MKPLHQSATLTGVEVPIPVFAFIAVSGTWTRSEASDVPILTRTPATSYGWVICELPAATLSASRGSKVTGFRISYTVATATPDDVYVDIVKVTDGAPPTAALQAFTYDSAHDSTAERKADGSHQMVVTLTSPSYLDPGVKLVVRFIVDGEAGGAASVSLRTVSAILTERMVPS